MAAPTIAEMLKYADLQMAAEALYRFNAATLGPTLAPGDIFSSKTQRRPKEDPKGSADPKGSETFSFLNQ